MKKAKPVASDTADFLVDHSGRNEITSRIGKLPLIRLPEGIRDLQVAIYYGNQAYCVRLITESYSRQTGSGSGSAAPTPAPKSKLPTARGPRILLRPHRLRQAEHHQPNRLHR